MKTAWNWMSDEEREEAEERAEFLAVDRIWKHRERQEANKTPEQRRTEHQQAITFGR